MKLFLWKDVFFIKEIDRGSILVVADDIHHAYGLMTKEGINPKCEAYNSKPTYVYELDWKHEKPEIILFLGQRE